MSLSYKDSTDIDVYIISENRQLSQLGILNSSDSYPALEICTKLPAQVGILYVFQVPLTNSKSLMNPKFKGQIHFSNISMHLCLKNLFNIRLPAKTSKTLMSLLGHVSRLLLSPRLGKAVTQLSSNLFSNTSALQQRALQSLTLVKRSCSLWDHKTEEKKKKIITTNLKAQQADKVTCTGNSTSDQTFLGVFSSKSLGKHKQ